MLNIIVLLALLLLMAGFFILAFRLKRSQRAWIKWPGMLLTGLLGLMLLATSAVVLEITPRMQSPTARPTIGSRAV